MRRRIQSIIIRELSYISPSPIKGNLPFCLLVTHSTIIFFIVRSLFRKLWWTGAWTAVTLGVVVWTAAWPWASSRSRVTLVLGNVSETSVARLVSSIHQQFPEFTQLAFVSKSEGLQRLSSVPGFDQWNIWLPENPVPPVLQLFLPMSWAYSDRLMETLALLQRFEGVKHVVVEVQAVQLWWKLLLGSGVLVWGAWGMVTWMVWALHAGLARERAAGLRGTVVNLKMAGVSVVHAVRLMGKTHLAESMVMGSVWGSALIIACGTTESMMKLVGVNPWWVFGVTFGVVMGWGEWMNRITWKRAVQAMWEDIR